ncbi:hypothetical protein GbCGDNIH6_8260 [Granulibacter bethesdensis]|nr:hypothetical protein GbCGDNIH6_8260 [Granulibacter bethesdensis]
MAHASMDTPCSGIGFDTLQQGYHFSTEKYFKRFVMKHLASKYFV